MISINFHSKKKQKGTGPGSVPFLLYFKLRILFVFFVVSFFPIFSLHSAETKSEKSETNTAFLFSLKSLFTPESDFNGGVGLQFYIKKDFALRLNFGFDYSSETRNKPLNTENDWVFSSSTIEFIPAIRKDFLSEDKIKIYSGICAIVSYSVDNETGRDYKNIDVATSKTGYGGGFFLGADWFPVKNFSLGAEYRMIAKGTSGSVETTDGTNIQTDKSPSKFSINLNASNINFILAYHF